MSRLYVTSSKARAQRAGDVCAGLSVSGSYEGKQCFARSYRKPSREEESFLRVGQDSFLAIAGTAIYDGGLGEERKEEIFELFVNGGVENVRSEIIGHYAITVKEKSEITLFTDPLGSFALYYTCGNGSWFASNSLHACAVSCDQVSLDAIRLVATIYQSGLPADRTFYRGIRRLFGSQILRSNTTEGSLHVEECTPPTYSLPEQPTSVPEAVDQYVERVRSVFGQIAEVGEIGIMLTGGLDSRTVLAGVLDQGKAPTILTGVGDNSRRNSDEDVRVAGKIAKEFGLSFQKIDWSDNQPHSTKKIKESFKKYGFKHEVYGSPNVFTEYLKRKGKKAPKLLLGGYSPAFTREKPWEVDDRELGIEYLIQDYLRIDKYNENLSSVNKYVEEVKKDAIKVIENKNEKRSKNEISKKEYMKSKLDLKINRDARFSNFANEFRHYVDPFRTKELYDPLREMSPEFRSGNRVQAGVIREMEGQLAQIEVHSGWEDKTISSGYLEDRKFRITLKDRLSSKYVGKKVEGLIDKYVPGGILEAVATVREAASSFWPQIHKEHAMKREYSRRLSNREVVRQHIPEVSALPLKALARLEYFVVGIETVADTLEKRSPFGSQK